MKVGRLQLSLPQSIVLAAGLVALGAALTWGPPDVRGPLVEWLGWGVAGLSALLGPLVRRHEAAPAAEEVDRG